jgi:ATP-binding cassette subfamily B protein
LSTVIDADTIVVMDQGRIVDQGKHNELLERCAEYRVLAQTQLRPSAA